MEREDRNKKNSVYNSFKGSLHMGMGVIYIVLGVSVVYFKSFGVMELKEIVAYIIGFVMVLYGSFRLWRGWMDLKRLRR